MIVKMSKYAFLVYHKEYDRFLDTLRDLGVVHIQEINSIADNERLQGLLAERKRVSALMRCLKGLQAGDKASLAPARHLSKEEGLALVGEIEALREKRARLELARQSVEKDIAYLELWGDFSYRDIDRLREAGYESNFFTFPIPDYLHIGIYPKQQHTSHQCLSEV